MNQPIIRRSMTFILAHIFICEPGLGRVSVDSWWQRYATNWEMMVSFWRTVCDNFFDVNIPLINVPKNSWLSGDNPSICNTLTLSPDLRWRISELDRVSLGIELLSTLIIILIDLFRLHVLLITFLKLLSWDWISSFQFHSVWLRGWGSDSFCLTNEMLFNIVLQIEEVWVVYFRDRVGWINEIGLESCVLGVVISNFGVLLPDMWVRKFLRLSVELHFWVL